MLTEYAPIKSRHRYACIAPGCNERAVVQSVTLSDFKWCVPHLVQTVSEQTAHQLARRDSRQEIDSLVSVLHGVYHRIEEGRCSDAARLIESAALRFPECAVMPSPV